jgi:hypothetical protein
MSDFCRHHGFYAPCPSCTGEEVIWEIPVIDGDGNQIDVFRLSEGTFEDAMAGVSYETIRNSGDHFQSGIPATASGRSSRRVILMPPAQDHIPLPVNPSLYARVRLLLQK